MGQRLALTLYDDEGNKLAAAYYHWAAYTGSSIAIINNAIEEWNDLPENMDKRIKAYKMLKATGAGIERSDIQNLLKNHEKYKWFNLETEDPQRDRESDYYLYNLATNRNEGLIAISQEGIDDIESSGEYSASINIDAQTVCFDVLNYYDGEDLEYYIDNDDIDKAEVENAPTFEYDLSSLSFDDFNNFVNDLNHMSGYYFKDQAGNVYSTIE